MVDTHCHLDACQPPTSELVARARDAGVRRIATVGTDPESIRRALESAEEHEEVHAIVGRHPHEAAGFDAAALEEIWRRVRRLNQYVQDDEPWQLAKDESQADRLDGVLYGLAEGLRVVSVLVHPFMPSSAERLLTALGREDRSIAGARFGAEPGGASVGELGQLFPKVEPPAADAA